MGDERFDNLPIILETPAPELWPEEIKWLRQFVN
jgi:deoxyribonuclease-4